MIDDSARNVDADIWFALPPGFIPLPLQELTTAEPEPAETVALLTGLGPVLRLAQLLLEAGAVHCCLGLHADDEGDGSPLLSLYTLAWRDTEWAPRSVLAARAAAGTDTAECIEMLDLPCGPAALVQTRMTAPPELNLGAPCELLQAAAYVPCVDGRRIAILSLATASVTRARQYRALLKEIANTVSFENPLPDVADDVSDKD
ncbi:hypothetical protein ABT404_31285 [Streptomyces hyaluromycini]|uniref:GAF domain-containing protein n=1 Tax=Streptomyces hyaluromycini TaxID=1377993 RepID=A0ABV1X4I1_9ACTN